MRFLRFFFIGIFVFATTARAQTVPNVLTEDDAVRLAQASQSVVALSAAQVDLARSDVTREQRWPNPTLEYTREDAGEAEQFLTLSQSFDFSGRRALRRRAAELRVEATEQEVAGQQLDLARIVRAEFSRAASQQELVRALTEWSRKIGAAAETAARLQAGGEVSGYDRRRLERERIGAEARLAAERGALVAAQRRLAGLLGVERLDGVTLQRPVPSDIPADAELTARVEQRPDVAAVGKRIEAATLDRQAAQRWRVPLFDLTAGMKNTEAASGAIIGAGVSLPLFNRNHAEVLRANAELAILNAQRTLLVTRARGEVSGLAAEARELRNAARLFREQALPTSERLTTTAEAAYRAGEVGILELLDAYRTALDAEVEAAELEQRAREAEIELTRALGGITR
ncbi:MAG TPA: TolC family protein [Thermoanaerobaculia bacterium]|nr:TolC family protein [Thermoanaerobaculia bacterium]